MTSPPGAAYPPTVIGHRKSASWEGGEEKKFSKRGKWGWEKAFSATSMGRRSDPRETILVSIWIADKDFNPRPPFSLYPTPSSSSSCFCFLAQTLVEELGREVKGQGGGGGGGGHCRFFTFSGILLLLSRNEEGGRNKYWLFTDRRTYRRHSQHTLLFTYVRAGGREGGRSKEAESKYDSIRSSEGGEGDDGEFGVDAEQHQGRLHLSQAEAEGQGMEEGAITGNSRKVHPAMRWETREEEEGRMEKEDVFCLEHVFKCLFCQTTKY